MSPNVRCVKHIRYLIKERSDIGDVEDVKEILDSATKAATVDHNTNESDADTKPLTAD